ncbi:MAG: hypothetical protein GEV07_16650 [Streptosporangiales bacterium]|nr:hypothetical protein [Streptosporangiales bacterium]
MTALSRSARESVPGAASCPGCGERSSRVHSRYERVLSDAAIGSQRVRIRLRVRRFLCTVARARAGRSSSRSRS